MNKTRTSYIALIIGALFISFSPVLIKATGAPGTITAFYRLIIGTAVLIAPFIISRLTSKEKLPPKGIWLATVAGLSLAIDMVLWTNGIMVSNAAMPTLVGNLAPLWVGFGSVLLFNEKQTKGFWIGVSIALAGVTMLILRDFYAPNGIFKGLILGLIAGMFYAGYMLMAQTGRKFLDTISFLFISSLATTIFLGAWALIAKIPFTGYSSEQWILFAIMGIFIQAGAWFLINYAIGSIKASVVSATLLGQPVLAGIISYFALNEVLSLNHVIGGIIVVIGIYTVHFLKQNK